MNPLICYEIILVVFKPVKSEYDMEAMNAAEQIRFTPGEWWEDSIVVIYGGIAFDPGFKYETDSDGAKTLPKELKYTVRMNQRWYGDPSNTEYMEFPWQLAGPGWGCKFSIKELKLMSLSVIKTFTVWGYETFCAFQSVVDLAFIEMTSGQKMLPTNENETELINFVRILVAVPDLHGLFTFS